MKSENTHIHTHNSQNLTDHAAQVVHTELDLGFTFLDGFRFNNSTGQTSRAEKNLVNAEAALDQARKFLPIARWTDVEKTDVEAKMNELEQLLSLLRQH